MTVLTDAPLKAPGTPEGSAAGPRRGVRDLSRAELKAAALAVKDSVKARRISLISAGVGFFGLLALVPAVVAIVSLYALMSDPADIARQIESGAAAIPDEVRSVITTQLESIAESPSGGLGLGVAIGVLAALWAASSGIQHLMEALNVAYGTEEQRGMVARRGTALALTAGAAGFVITAVGVIAVLPTVLDGDTFGPAADAAVRWARWPLLAGAVLCGLAILYRVGPCRPRTRMRWVSPGAVMATLLILAGSALFSWYTAALGSYNETYGSLGTAVVVMLWLYLLALSVMIGAEVDNELDRRLGV